MKNKDFLAYMKTQKPVQKGTEVFEKFHTQSQEALKITMELNNKYHTPEEIVEIFSKLTDKKVDKTFRMFPPFYTDCGLNITVGKNVFINACCKFQDQGGIEIGDNVLIGHSVVIATLNHDFNPALRANMTPKRVKIGNNVWIGSNVTILPGVEIGGGTIVGAGSVVTKSLPQNCIAAGNPAKIIKYLE